MLLFPRNFFFPKKYSSCDEAQTQIVMKLKNQIVMKLNSSNCDETQIIMNLKNQLVMKLKNSNCDETQKRRRCSTSGLVHSSTHS